MAQIDLNFQASPPATCRVDLLGRVTPDVFRGITVGSQTYQAPNETIYQHNGMIVRDWDAGLRLPQRASFLKYPYTEGGCLGLTCKDSTLCPASQTATTSPQMRAMENASFGPNIDFVTNDFPPIYQYGCPDYNMAAGWQVMPDGGLLWKQRDPSQSNPVPNLGPVCRTSS